MAVYLTSFYPLYCNRKGKKAVSQHKLPPFIDGACRREPDFQHKNPAITALCRPGFSEKLDVGDLVIYQTNKKGVEERKLVAILEVIQKYDDHDSAAEYYQGNLPSNIMTDGTAPFPLDKTHQMMGWEGWASKKKKITTLEEWEDEYQKRSDDNKYVAVCKVWNKHKYLVTPPPITDSDLKKIFDRIPGTQNPPRLTSAEWKNYQKWLEKI